MKTMALTGPRAMKLREAQKPRPDGERDVLIRIREAGVCGSDTHYFTSGHIGDQAVSYPFTIGHECSGVVEETGAEVKIVRPGSRVAVDPAVSCGACEQCRNGRPHTCLNLLFLGCPGQMEGCLAEFIVMPEANCHPLRRRTAFAAGVLSEPLAIALYACRLAGGLAGKRVAILGSGPVGLSVLLAARFYRAGGIHVTDKIAFRAEAAARAGADWTGAPGGLDAEGEMDIVFECCGCQEAADQAVRLLKPGGKLVMIGIPAEDRLSFDFHRMRRKEILFQNVRRQNDGTRQAVELIESGRIDPSFMATHRFPLDRAAEAFDLVSAYRDGVIKAIITID